MKQRYEGACKETATPKAKQQTSGNTQNLLHLVVTFLLLPIIDVTHTQNLLVTQRHEIGADMDVSIPPLLSVQKTECARGCNVKSHTRCPIITAPC